MNQAATTEIDTRIIDGKGFAEGLRARIAEQVTDLKAQHGGLTPGLAVIIVGDDPASQIYVRNKGKIAAEVYTKLGQVDYAAEIANLRAAKPDAVFFFLPGGMGVNFIKQYAQSGLTGSIPLYGPAFSFDEGILGAVGDAAVGTFNTSQYSHDLDNAANKAFAGAYIEAYGRKPSLYASQGYDAALLLDGAIAKVGGNMDDADAFRAALKAAEFNSVRGAFKFGPNQHPIQDIYVREVIKDGDAATNEIVAKVFTNHGDAYAVDCKM